MKHSFRSTQNTKRDPVILATVMSVNVQRRMCASSHSSSNASATQEVRTSRMLSARSSLKHGGPGCRLSSGPRMLHLPGNKTPRARAHAQTAAQQLTGGLKHGWATGSCKVSSQRHVESQGARAVHNRELDSATMPISIDAVPLTCSAKNVSVSCDGSYTAVVDARGALYVQERAGSPTDDQTSNGHNVLQDQLRQGVSVCTVLPASVCVFSFRCWHIQSIVIHGTCNANVTSLAGENVECLAFSHARHGNILALGTSQGRVLLACAPSPGLQSAQQQDGEGVDGQRWIVTGPLQGLLLGPKQHCIRCALLQDSIAVSEPDLQPLCELHCTCLHDCNRRATGLRRVDEITMNWPDTTAKRQPCMTLASLVACDCMHATICPRDGALQHAPRPSMWTPNQLSLQGHCLRAARSRADSGCRGWRRTCLLSRTPARMRCKAGSQLVLPLQLPRGVCGRASAGAGVAAAARAGGTVCGNGHRDDCVRLVL
jgi:hypothetical protein